jgi:acetyl-CoA synthetase
LDAIWEDFLPAAPFTEFIPAEPARAINILFSSGTTGDPKAIPWDHATAIKAAADGHFHQDIRPGDVVAWPTNLGWMMGPWLIFAALLNRAAIALYEGAPGTRGFCKFVEEAGVTMLGVIPSIVKAWISTKATAGCDWSALRAFSSTGECSAPADMAWLMAQPGGRGRPVIEYCGGTEIGGGYITNVIAEPCYPGHFNTPALGLDLVLLDEDGRPAPQGEVFLMPPSLGLSTRLLNADHDKIYYEGLPTGLRRHGDRIEALPGGQWRGHGRADDAMNLGGIKVSSAEIERALQVVPGLVESAAIAVSPDGGPSLLVIYAVAQGEREPLLQAMQAAIRRDLNPLFKIHDLVLVESLPRTATNKVMRRVLRDQYPPQEFPGPKSERNTIT